MTDNIVIVSLVRELEWKIPGILFADLPETELYNIFYAAHENLHCYSHPKNSSASVANTFCIDDFLERFPPKLTEINSVIQKISKLPKQVLLADQYATRMKHSRIYQATCISTDTLINYVAELYLSIQALMQSLPSKKIIFFFPSQYDSIRSIVIHLLNSENIPVYTFENSQVDNRLFISKIISSSDRLYLCKSLPVELTRAVPPPVSARTASNRFIKKKSAFQSILRLKYSIKSLQLYYLSRTQNIKSLAVKRYTHEHIRLRKSLLRVLFSVSCFINKSYSRLCKNRRSFSNVFSQKYSILALHLYPENGNIVDFLPVTDETDIFFQVYSLLPLRSSLLVAEHPLMSNSGERSIRTQNFYASHLDTEYVANLSGIPLSILKSAQHVYSIGGSISVEAAKYNIPSTIFSCKPISLINTVTTRSVNASPLFQLSYDDYVKLATDFAPFIDEGAINVYDEGPKYSYYYSLIGTHMINCIVDDSSHWKRFYSYASSN